MTAHRAAPGGGGQQPALWAPDAELVMLAALYVLAGDGKKDRGYMSLVIDGVQHTPKCPFGQWLAQKEPGQPKGDPCSERCENARWAVGLLKQWIWANRPAQVRERESA